MSRPRLESSPWDVLKPLKGTLPKRAERNVKDDVKDFLTSIGAYWWMHVPSGYGKSSLDFVVCYRGRYIEIETKRPGVTRPTVRQGEIIKAVRAAGGIAIVADSVEYVRMLFADEGLL